MIDYIIVPQSETNNNDNIDLYINEDGIVNIENFIILVPEEILINNIVNINPQEPNGINFHHYINKYIDNFKVFYIFTKSNIYQTNHFV